MMKQIAYFFSIILSLIGIGDSCSFNSESKWEIARNEYKSEKERHINITKNNNKLTIKNTKSESKLTLLRADLKENLILVGSLFTFPEFSDRPRLLNSLLTKDKKIKKKLENSQRIQSELTNSITKFEKKLKKLINKREKNRLSSTYIIESIDSDYNALLVLSRKLQDLEENYNKSKKGLEYKIKRHRSDEEQRMKQTARAIIKTSQNGVNLISKKLAKIKFKIDSIDWVNKNDKSNVISNLNVNFSNIYSELNNNFISYQYKFKNKL